MSLFPLILINGLIDSINPCAITVLILFISLLIGLGRDRRTILWMGGIYIIVVYLTYFLIGLGILKVTFLLGVPHLMARIGAIIAFIFGFLYLKDYFFPQLPPHFTKTCGAKKIVSSWVLKATILSTFVLAFLVALTEFPCSGAIYFATLGLLSAKTTFIRGVIYLLFYNLMFVSPLVFIYLIASNRKIIEKYSRYQAQWGNKINSIMGLFLIGLGILILLIVK